MLAIEADPPAGQTPLTWRLLTTWPVETDDDVLALIEAYSLRWLIERFHFVLKSGCRVEQLQLDREVRLERALATYSIVASRLLRLTYLARRDPAAAGLSELTTTEWQVLQAHDACPAESRRHGADHPSGGASDCHLGRVHGTHRGWGPGRQNTVARAPTAPPHEPRLGAASNPDLLWTTCG